MNMRILIVMNIYITIDNEKKLREMTDRTMSGLINYLLIGYWKEHKPKEVSDYVEDKLPKGMINPFRKQLPNMAAQLASDKIKVIKTKEDAEALAKARR